MDTLVKTTVKELARVVQKTGAMGYSQGLDFVSKKFGFADWNAFNLRLGDVTIAAKDPDQALEEYAVACGCRNWRELKDAISEVLTDDSPAGHSEPATVLKVADVPFGLRELAMGMLFLGQTNGVTAAMVAALRDSLDAEQHQDMRPGAVLFDFNQSLRAIALEIGRKREGNYEVVVLDELSSLPLFETDDPRRIVERLRIVADAVTPAEPWDAFMERIVWRIIGLLRTPANQLLFELRRIFCTSDEHLVHFVSQLVQAVTDGPDRREILDDLRTLLENIPLRDRLRKSFDSMLRGIEHPLWRKRFGCTPTKALLSAFKRGTIFVVPLDGIEVSTASVAAILLKLSFQSIARGLVPSYGADARRVIFGSSWYDAMVHFGRPADGDFFSIVREASVIPIMQLHDPAELKQRYKNEDQFMQLLGCFGSVISQTPDLNAPSSEAAAVIEKIMHTRRSLLAAGDRETFQSLARPLPKEAIEVLKFTW